MKLVIWDIDNCLADDSHRMRLIDWGSSDPTQRYAAYHDACKDDPAPPAGSGLLFANLKATGHIPLFITGRPDSQRIATENWLRRYLGADLGAYGDRSATLLMRPDGCELPSVELKFKLLEGWLALYGGRTQNEIVMAFDDHRGILDMYRERFGIPAFMLKIHDLDAYRGEAQLSRSDGGHQAFLDKREDAGPAPIEELGPQQGARPGRAKLSAADVLRAMAATFEERNANYKDNFRNVGLAMKALHPEGVSLHSDKDHELFHLWSLVIVKLSRFAAANLEHKDSIHDAAIYCAMIESILQERENGNPL